MSQAQIALLSSGSPRMVSPEAGRSLDQAVSRILPTPAAEAKLQQARRIMGDQVYELTDTELGEHLTQFNYLVDQWLDEFERGAFEGKTLREFVGS